MLTDRVADRCHVIKKRKKKKEHIGRTELCVGSSKIDGHTLPFSFVHYTKNPTALFCPAQHGFLFVKQK